MAASRAAGSPGGMSAQAPLSIRSASDRGSPELTVSVPARMMITTSAVASSYSSPMPRRRDRAESPSESQPARAPDASSPISASALGFRSGRIPCRAASAVIASSSSPTWYTRR